MKVPFYTSTREYNAHKKEFNDAISEVLEKGDFILGGKVKELEENISNYAKIKYAVGVGSGSDGLVIASDTLGYKKNAKVITPVFTFFASTSCVARLGGVPVFCDVEPDTYLMDMQQAGNLVTKETKGLLPVHLFSQMASMDEALKISKSYNLTILEDAAEAFGMQQTIDGQVRTAGTIGEAGVYSFFPTKTLGGYGDGGMVITNNLDIYNKVKSLRVHGSSIKYHHDYIGYNSRLDTLQATILSIKLKYIDSAIKKRAEVASQYSNMLGDISQVKLPVVDKKNKPVWYVYSIQAQDRDKLVEYLRENGIGISIYYPIPLHLQKCFSYLGYKEGDFPVAERLSKCTLSLPIYPEITTEEVSYVCDKIKEFYRK